MVDRIKLNEKAKSLGLEIDDDMSDDDVTSKITEAEKTSNKEDDTKDVDFYKTEFEKAKGKRDDLRLANRKLKESMEDLQNKLADAPDKEEFKKLRDQFNDLKEFRTQIEKEREEEDLKQKSELERSQISFNKEMDRFKREFEEEKVKFNSLLKEKDDRLLEEAKKTEIANKRALKGSIIESAAKYDAVNPNQVFKILKDDFEYDTDLDRYVYFDKDEKGKLKDELSIDEYINKFLSDDSNSNLVKSKVNTDGLHTDNKSSDKKSSDKKRGKYDPKDVKLIEESVQKNFSNVNDYIDILEIRDAKLTKISNKD
jgi:hypothetical protein